VSTNRLFKEIYYKGEQKHEMVYSRKCPRSKHWGSLPQPQPQEKVQGPGHRSGVWVEAEGKIEEVLLLGLLLSFQ
jgi:hypothetical protein